jgi:hypothetical protein
MNSIAQHAVPNGSGQREFEWAHWTRRSSFVVRKSAPPVDGTPGAIGGAIAPGTGCEGRTLFLIEDPSTTLVKSVTFGF